MHSTFPNIHAKIQILAKVSREKSGLCLGCWNVAVECLLSRSDRSRSIWRHPALPYEFSLPATADRGVV